jgi:hypothetical protein
MHLYNPRDCCTSPDGMRAARYAPRGLVLVLALGLFSGAGTASAQYEPRDNPHAYDLRIAAFPVAFQAAISQSHFGSAVRGEVDLSRRFVLGLAGRLPWLALAGETEPQGFTLRAGFAWNFSDEVLVERLAGSVYPQDPPSVAERAGLKFEGPVHQKLGSPPFLPPESDRGRRVATRNAHALRLGYDFVRTVERGRPNVVEGETRYFENTLHVLSAGYGWSTHWNLSVATAGKREIGWRRFSVDVLLTADPLAKATPVHADPSTPESEPDFLPVGARLAMEGCVGALLRRAPGVGFGYSLELGALPGSSGLEGYLFVGLGVELDFALRARRR